MTRAVSTRSARAGNGGIAATAVSVLQDYMWRSNLPLTSLLFLLPMIVMYEIGTGLFASDFVRNTETRVLAFNLLRQFMELFGATGRYLPGLAVLGILLTWHIARRDPWELNVGTAMGMLVESALLAFPLLALGNVLGNYLSLAAQGVPPGGFVLALGAGIYEELVFRLAAFTLLNILLVDLLRLNKRTALMLIIISTSVIFSAYHYWSPQSPPFRWSDAIFRTASGGIFWRFVHIPWIWCNCWFAHGLRRILLLNSRGGVDARCIFFYSFRGVFGYNPVLTRLHGADERSFRRRTHHSGKDGLSSGNPRGGARASSTADSPYQERRSLPH